MIDLAIALALADNGFGEYGKNIFWNVSPVMGSGQVSGEDGIWVNSIPNEVIGDWYQDGVTISTRFRDSIKQAKTLLKLMEFLRGPWSQTCTLSTDPIVSGMTFNNVQITPPTSTALEAVDGEGRWVKAIQFSIKYKLPDPIPDLS